MNKQEKIREWVANRIRGCLASRDNDLLIGKNAGYGETDLILKYLHSQGLGIQTGDVPEEYWIWRGNNIDIKRMPTEIRNFLSEYKKVEPLIEGVTSDQATEAQKETPG